MNLMTFLKPIKSLAARYKRLMFWYKPFNSPKFIHELSLALYEFGYREDVYCIKQFLVYYNIPQSLFNEWLQRFPELQVAYEQTVTAIGCRRELAAIHNKINAQVIMETQWFYDDVWKQSEERHAELNGINNQLPNNNAPEITINCPYAPTQQKTIQHHIKPQIVNDYMQPEFRDDLIKELKQDMLNLLASVPRLIEEPDAVTH